MTFTLTLASTALTMATMGQQKFPERRVMTAEEDHKATMEMMGITSLRRWADGDPKSEFAANADEAKANVYTNYPEVLKFKNGKPVKTAKDWTKRREEIAEDFDREIYGRTPKTTPKVNWEVKETKDETVGDKAVVTKVLVGHVDNSSYPLVSVDIDLKVTTPKDAKGPVPVILEFGFNFPAGFRPPQPPEGQKREPSWQEQVISRGWGYAILVPTTVQADNGGGLTAGIIGLVNKGQLRKKDDWGSLKAWAWGASRALDYLIKDPATDGKRVAIEGLSRYGKAALVTMAYDTRFSAALVGSSGEGGAKLWRRNFGETEGNLASSGEYHWMTPNFMKYAGPLTPGDMPVDSHELIAMCAPRPTFVGCGSPNVEGNWLDDKGMFMATAMASPVYKLLGKRGLGTSTMPEIESGLLGGELAWRQHSGPHTNGPNWPSFLDWVSRYFEAKK